MATRNEDSRRKAMSRAPAKAATKGGKAVVAKAAPKKTTKADAKLAKPQPKTPTKKATAKKPPPKPIEPTKAVKAAKKAPVDAPKAKPSKGEAAKAKGPEAKAKGPEAKAKGPEAKAKGPEAKAKGPEAKAKAPEVAKAKAPEVAKAKAKAPEPAKGARPAGKLGKVVAPSAPVASTSSSGSLRAESDRSNSAFARPSPWSAPALPPVRVDTTRSEPVTKGDAHVEVVGELKVGEVVVYPTHGVVTVTGVGPVEVGGRMVRVYTLVKPETNQIIRVPVTNTGNFRRPISEAQVREIFRVLRLTDVPIDTQTWNRRYRGFQEKLATNDIIAVAEVYRDLSRVRLIKDVLSWSERQMLEKARGLLVKEIAISRSKPEEQIREQVEAIFA